MMFEDNLKTLKKLGLFRQIYNRASGQGPVIRINRKKYINFSSNDYLGLANHPALVSAAEQAMHTYGFGAGASRLLAGGTLIHEKLEKDIAAWKRTDAALLFNSGYAANTGIIPAIAEEGDIIFSDELNHASIIDGCRLSKAKTVIYRHKDIEHLEKLLKQNEGRRNIIATDTVFSMDGDIAPLGELCTLCRAVNSKLKIKDSTLLYLDDAHATGVLGKGRGALTHFGIGPEPWIIQMGTFSKALGSFGAFISGNRDIIQWISNRARSLIFSTALPAASVAAARSALQLIRKERMLLKKLWSNRTYLEKALGDLGYEISGSTPIMPIITSSTKEAVRLSQFLFGQGIYVPAIRPPTVKKPRIRIVVTAVHEKNQLEKLVNALKKWKK